MASSLSPRALAAMLRQLQQEKESRVHEDAVLARKRLDEAERDRSRELEEVIRAKLELQAKLEREEKQINSLRHAVEEQLNLADDEQRVQHVLRRMEEFRGNDDESVRERLIAEGFGEQLVTQLLRLRTLEQKVESDTAMHAAWSHSQHNPLERIMQGSPSLYDLTDKRVLERLDSIRRSASEAGYLAGRERAFVEHVEYHAHRFHQDPEHREKDERGYLSRAAKTVEDIRQELGLDGPTFLYRVQTRDIDVTRRVAERDDTGRFEYRQ